MGLVNSFKRKYKPQMDGKKENLNRTILQMIRCYVAENQDMTYSYNLTIHRSAGQESFELVWREKPEEFSLR